MKYSDRNVVKVDAHLHVGVVIDGKLVVCVQHILPIRHMDPMGHCELIHDPVNV